MKDDYDKGEAKQGSGKKWLAGCGIGCLVLVLLGTIGTYVGYRYMMGLYQEWIAEFVDQGYEKVEGQIVEVRNDVTKPTVFAGQVVKIFANSSTDVAVVGQLCEVHGTITGKLSFRGQLLTIMKGAVVEGDLDVKAQVVNVEGAVSGEIRGQYQSIHREDK